MLDNCLLIYFLYKKFYINITLLLIYLIIYKPKKIKQSKKKKRQNFKHLCYILSIYIKQYFFLKKKFNELNF